MNSFSQTHHLHFTIQDRQRNPYHLLPFDVPAGVARLTVQYSFTPGTRESPASKNTIDLGLFDSRGHEFLAAPGFRGWSGSARKNIALTAHEATPGYLPGPLYPGAWHVLLGLYEIALEGCDVNVLINMESDVPLPLQAKSSAKMPDGPLCFGPAWYRGDLHCHTHHSDGAGSLADLATTARAQGLDFLAVTEHNTISHLPHLAQYSGPDLLLIPGMEITTYYGHANVWGIHEWVDFRATNEGEMRQIRERVREMGLLFSINHPKYGGPPWEFSSDLDADAVEGWQIFWCTSNHESLALWDSLLRQGRRVILVGGSDKHQKPLAAGFTVHDLTPYEVGTPTTWVYADNLSEEAILAGLRAGHAFVSQDPKGPQVELSAQADGQTVIMGDELRVSKKTEVIFRCRIIGGENCSERGGALRVMHRDGEAFRILIGSQDFVYTWPVIAQSDDDWRVQVIEPTNMPLSKDPVALWAFALSNPIYIRAT